MALTDPLQARSIHRLASHSNVGTHSWNCSAAKRTTYHRFVTLEENNYHKLWYFPVASYTSVFRSALINGQR